MSLTPRLDRAEKNFLINSNFDLWQRGTSLVIASGASDKNYLADRWSHTNFFASGSITVSRSVDVPSGLKDATYSMSTAITTAVSVAHATNNYSVNAGVYRMEGYDAAKLHGKTVTLQFWVKSSLTGLYSVAVGSNFDTGITSASYVSTYTVNAANTWEQKSLTLLIDNTVGSFAKDNTQGLFVGFGLAARVGSTRETSTLNQWGAATSAYVASTANRTDFIGTIGNTIRIAQVKLSIGSQVTDFSTRGETFGDELALCQRYYEKSYNLDVVPGTATSTFAEGIIGQYTSTSFTGVQVLTYAYSVRKRAGGVVVVSYDGVGNSNRVRIEGIGDNQTAYVIITGSERSFRMESTTASAKTGITFNYTADAEL